MFTINIRNNENLIYFRCNLKLEFNIPTTSLVKLLFRKNKTISLIWIVGTDTCMLEKPFDFHISFFLS